MTALVIDDTGLDFWNRYCTQFEFYHPIFKQLLHPGSNRIRNGDMICIAGRSGSGKTLLLQHLLVEIITPVEFGGLGAGVVYLDADSSLDFHRFLKLLDVFGSQHSGLDETVLPCAPTAKKLRRLALRNFFYQTLDTPQRLENVISHLPKLLKTNSKIRFILLDSLTGCPTRLQLGVQSSFPDDLGGTYNTNTHLRNISVTEIFKKIQLLQFEFNEILVYTKKIEEVGDSYRSDKSYKLNATLPFIFVERFFQPARQSPRSEKHENANPLEASNSPNSFSFVETGHPTMKMRNLGMELKMEGLVDHSFVVPKRAIDELSSNASTRPNTQIKDNLDRRIYKLFLSKTVQPMTQQVHKMEKALSGFGTPLLLPTYISCIVGSPLTTGKDATLCKANAHDAVSVSSSRIGHTAKVSFFSILGGFLIPIKAHYHEMS